MKKFFVETVLFYDSKFGQEYVKRGDTVLYNNTKTTIVEIHNDKVDLDCDGGLLSVDIEYFVDNFKPFVDKKKMVTIIKK